MRWALLDSGVYIGHWERGLYREALAWVRRGFVVRHSVVVLSELRRGARARKARELVDRLYEAATVRWEPTADDWWEAGKLVREIGDEHSWEINKRREFQNDVLIALTARRHGATVVTTNRADFQILANRVQVRVVPV